MVGSNNEPSFMSPKTKPPIAISKVLLTASTVTPARIAFSRLTLKFHIW